MYEISPNETSKNLWGKFVQFDPMYTDKIMLAHTHHCLIGVTSPNFLSTSDNLKEWPNKYVCNDYNDPLMRNVKIVKATCYWDDKHEMEIIKTEPEYVYNPIISTQYDKDKEYVQRLDRDTWYNVILLGKCIVTDNGHCIPGEYCEPYCGSDMKLFGTAVPSINSQWKRFYVMSRISEKTIMILMT